MLNRIKERLNRQLEELLESLDKTCSLTFLSPLLAAVIRKFILRDGKRIRPLLFVAGYQGFSRKTPAGLYRAALAFELLHDFMLVHDDIIDKSDLRRGKPSLHRVLDNYLKKHANNIKFDGKDLAIAAGDVIYALAIEAFLAVRAEPLRKEKALHSFIKTAVHTGSGEFLELLGGIKNIAKTTEADIYKIYDYKTADYTFAGPFSTGAMLAGTNNAQVKKLFRCGVYLGRAF